MNFAAALVLTCLLVPIALTLAFMPLFTRETISFGVSVSEEMNRSEPLNRLRRRFIRISCIGYALIFAASLTGMIRLDMNGQGWLLTVCITAMLVFHTFLYLRFHFMAKTIKETLPQSSPQRQIVAVDTSFRNTKLVLSNLWFLIHAAIAGISAVWTLTYYDRIPDTLAMKFDFAGNVTQTAAKSYLNVFLPNILQVIMILVFLMINWSIGNSKQQLDPNRPEQSKARNTIFRRRWSLFSIMSGLLIVLLFSCIQVNMVLQLDPNLLTVVSLIIPVVIVVAALGLTITTGQGGSRIGRTPDASPSTYHPNDDRHWKLGLFYFNRQDPSLFVEKRMGVGWTINHAHPLGWLILLAPIVLIVLVTLLAR
ncbi:DUF5808 domain-containing protein [Paenibacillus sp. FSL M8-0334]|uniref:DUF1648 domain-containing protein n=1 Tax=Paenibacillus sp. FSL M8-0334 TaxID=2921623 RepID=UPI0030FB7664